MVERSSPRRAMVVLAVTAGLWIGGCATTEAENSGGPGEPGIAYTVGAVLGEVVSGFFTGFLTGWTGQPQYQSGYQSPTYSTRGYVQSYGRPVQSSPASHRTHHRHRH